VSTRYDFPFSVFSHFSVYSVLRLCGRNTKVKGVNTEGTEKIEVTAKSGPHAQAE
jgi:hypothetical protein